MTIETLEKELREIVAYFDKGYIESEQISCIQSQLANFVTNLNAELNIPADENITDEHTPLLSQHQAQSREQQLAKMKLTVTAIQQKISNADKACRDYKNHQRHSVIESLSTSTPGNNGELGTSANPQNDVHAVNLLDLPPDIKRLILQSFPFIKQQKILQLVCKDFYRIINNSWITNGAVVYPVEDRQIVYFLDQPEFVNSTPATRALDLKKLMRDKSQEARELVIDIVKSGKVSEWNEPNSALQKWSQHGLKTIAFLFGCGGVSTMLIAALDQQIAEKVMIAFVLAIVAVVIPLLYIEFSNVQQQLASCYANLKYGRFFSSARRQDPVLENVDIVSPDLHGNNEALISSANYTASEQCPAGEKIQLVIHNISTGTADTVTDIYDDGNGMQRINSGMNYVGLS